MAVGRVNRRGRSVPLRGAPEPAPPAVAEEGMVTALARGLAVLQAVGQARVLSNAEIAQATALPKATVARLVDTLLKLKYLVEGPGGRGYQVGSGAMALGYGYLAAHDISVLVQQVQRQLADRYPCACSLVAREGLELVYLGQTRNRSARLMINVSVGARLAFNGRISGHAIVAGSRPEEAVSVLEAYRHADPKGWNSLRDGLATSKKEFETRGFCSRFEDDRGGILAVSSPIVSRGQVYALTCAVPGSLATRDFMLEEVGPELVRRKEELKKRLPQ